MFILVWCFIWVMFVIGYLTARVAFQEGRKSKWEEMSREYICIHKSVLITYPNQNGVKKTLDKKEKKIYNKSSYKKLK